MTSPLPTEAARSVAVFLTAKESAYQQALLVEARETARRLGLKLETSFGENQFEVQIKQIYSTLGRPREPGSGAVDALVILPIKEGGYARIAANAARAGVPCIFLNRTVDLARIRKETPEAHLSVVTPDQRRSGLEQGLQYRAWFEEAGKVRSGAGRRVLYVMGPADTSSARDRLEGMREALSTGPAELIVVNSDWTEEGARDVVSRALKGMKDPATIEVIVSQNDEMARGATRALNRLPGRLPVFGLDGLPAFGQRLVDEGQLVATVIMPTTTGPALELLVKLFRGEPTPPLVTLQPRWYPEKKALLERARRWAAAHLA